MTTFSVVMGILIYRNDFADYLETVILCKEQVVIVGDFNIHWDGQSNSDSAKFQDLLESFYLQQQVAGQSIFMVTPLS